MGLEDFEKSLIEEAKAKEHAKSHHRHDHRINHHHKHRHHGEDAERHERHKRRKLSRDAGASGHRQSRDQRHGITTDLTVQANHSTQNPATLSIANDPKQSVPSNLDGRIKRDSWMEQPFSLDADYAQKGAKRVPESAVSRSSKADFELKIHENELNKHHLQDLADGRNTQGGAADKVAHHDVLYTFGDAGAQWRMTKLKGVYRRAEVEGKSVDEVAKEQFGDLRSFDDAREEHTELERRDTYGEGYIGKEKPSGELFEERNLHKGIRRQPRAKKSVSPEEGVSRSMDTGPPTEAKPAMDQTGLNRLKAQMLKAKVRGGPDAARLDAEYAAATATSQSQQQPGCVVLNAMDNKMLAGGRGGEVRAVDSKRGRERGLVEENEDMTVEDMVREERRTRGQAGGDGRRFAERIAKDGKFDNDLDYMDENATKLAKRVQKSEINLKNTAISDFQKMNRILDTCPLCHHEDTDTPPVAPLVSLATRVYLTLPTEPEISDGGACIIPVQHRINLLECDDDEWEEIRNFMKSLTRMYHDQGRDVIFYENAAAPQRRRHASMEVVPLPYSLGETAPAFFKEAMMTADEEWTQHKKIIDTLAKARNGLGKVAFRRTLVKEMPYFHVWFEMDGGLGHVVEDSDKWPKGNLFAREVIGGMLDVGPHVIKRQGKWSKGDDPRVHGFQKRWRKFDWTRVLTDG
ncbi:MAG: hypothetical protein Q9164_004022 [Protoblastenia rupestris]